MDSLFDILESKDFNEPPEIAGLKDYIRKSLGIDVGVQVRDKDIVIIVANSAIANTLRMKSPELRQQLKITKRLVFRIVG